MARNQTAQRNKKGKPMKRQSPDELWKFHEDRHFGKLTGSTLDNFIQACVYGYFDGYCDRMIIERHPIGIDAKGQSILHCKEKPGKHLYICLEHERRANCDMLCRHHHGNV